MISEKISESIKSRKLVFYISITLFLLIIGIFSVINRAQWREPYVGLNYKTDASGLVYLEPLPDGTAAKNGIRYNDLLLQVEGSRIYDDGSGKKVHWLLNNRFEIKTTIIYKGTAVQTWIDNIDDISEIGKIVFHLGEGSVIKYIVLRKNKPFEIHVPVEMVNPQNQTEYFFLAFIGLLTLTVGIFVFVAKKPGIRGRNIFFLFTLNMFVLLAFSYTIDEAPFSRLILYLDIVSRIMFAPLFLHYLITIIGIKRFRRFLLSVIYTPTVVLLGLELLIFNYTNIFNVGEEFIPKFNAEFFLLSRIELLLFAIYIMMAALILTTTYSRTSNLILRKQLKMITIGIVAGVFPLIIFYLFPYILDNEINVLTGMMVTPPLIILPLSLGYAVVRHRLMDIEMQLRRALAYAVSIIALLFLYFTSVILIVPNLQTWSMVLILALVTLLLAFIYDPISSFIRNSLEKVLYKESYDFRKTLNRFSLELGAEHNLKQLLYNIISRLHLTFTVERVSAWIYDESKRGFELYISYPSKSSEDTTKRWRRKELNKQGKLALSRIFSDYILLRKNSDRIIDFEEMSHLKEEFIGDKEILHAYSIDYIVPLSFRDKIHAIITISRKKSGDLFTSEDIQLLDIIRLPAAIAYENAKLIDTVKIQSEENRNLSEFNTNILESIHGSVVVVNRQGSITHYNWNFTEMFDLKDKMIKGKKLKDILPLEFSKQLFIQLIADIFKSNKSHNLYKILYSNVDKKMYLNISLSPMLMEGRNQGNVLLFEDVTLRTMIEEKIVQTDKLLSLGVLAAGMAHEVNTPLAGISSYVQMLMKTPVIKEKNTEILKKIEQQTVRVKNLVNRLLDFGRPKKMEFHPLNVNDLIMDVYELFGPQFEKSGIEIVIDLKKDIRPVYGDSARLQQVVLNLLINARDAITNGGQIVIRTTEEDSNCTISIEDDGMGISEKDILKIYDPFFTTKLDRGGTGLGLSISYSIIREHLGTISVYSRISKGTIFIIRLPIIREITNEK